MIPRLAASPVMAFTLLRTYGTRGLLRRAVHEVRSRFNLFAARPRATPAPGPTARPVPYRPAPRAREALAAVPAVVRGGRVLEGWFQAHAGEWRRLPESAPEWRRYPGARHTLPPVPWWQVPLREPGVDIKDVWEPGRFAWAYDLIRAHAVTRDDRYCADFYRRLAAWEEANPPFRGPQWACGQETAIRALAILHAEDGLPGSPEDARRVLRVLSWSGERIADAIGYGLSQRNNHGISEAAGLVHLGLRLRDLHPQATRWLARGTRLLNEQLLDQFSSDGWYAQHSFNYMRLALEQALYAQRALQAANGTLSAPALSRLDAAVALLACLIEGRSGEVPNHGGNDGARILPLSTAAYRDFRPLMTLAAIVRGSALPADVPYDAEVAAWLGREPPPPAAARSDGVSSGPSGWAVARVSGCIVFLRAGSYQHRPAHLDALHLDVRVAGHEIVTDPGSYSYCAPPPWNNGLVAAEVHNGPILDAEVLARRGPRYLWLTWPVARLVAAEYGAGSARLVAERPGAVRREVRVTGDRVVVTDVALRSEPRSLQITWLLHPDAHVDELMVSDPSERLEGREGDTAAWFSPTYGVRVSSHAIRVRRSLAEGTGGIQTTILLTRQPASVPR